MIKKKWAWAAKIEFQMPWILLEKKVPSEKDCLLLQYGPVHTLEEKKHNMTHHGIIYDLIWLDHKKNVNTLCDICSSNCEFVLNKKK